MRDVAGTVIASVSIGAPVVRLGAARRRELGALVAEAGEAISRRLGWSPEAAPSGRPPRPSAPTSVTMTPTGSTRES